MVGKHAVKQQIRGVRERKRTNRKRRGAKPSAVSMAGLLAGGLVLAAQPPWAGPAAPTTHAEVSLAASIMFIDGHNYPYGSTRMANEITGQYQYQPCTAPCTHLTTPTTSNFIFINEPEQYSGTLGLIDGPTAPTGDQSIAMGQLAIEQQLLSNPPSNANPVTVVGYSEGAVAASHEVSKWAPTDNIGFVLIGDPERPNGGISARFPAGTYIPVLGITVGDATPSTAPPAVMVTQQYDGVADAPVYIGNVLADLNALLGAYYLHANANYFDVNPNVTGNIVTTSAHGNMTDILVPAAPGALPLFVPLAQAGVPQPILVALDPAVRAIIETGYDRTSDPSQQVMFSFLPPPTAWPGDAQALAAGFALTAQQLPAAITASLSSPAGLPVPLPTTTSPTPPSGSVTTTALVPHKQLVSELLPTSHAQPTAQVQPASQLQQDAVTNQMDNAGTGQGQQRTPTPVEFSTNASPPKPPRQPGSTPTNTTTSATAASGNERTAPPTSTRPNASNTSNAPHEALTTNRNATNSVTGTSQHSASTSGSSPQAKSGSPVPDPRTANQ
jgi:hypothetical protein